MSCSFLVTSQKSSGASLIKRVLFSDSKTIAALVNYTFVKVLFNSPQNSRRSLWCESCYTQAFCSFYFIEREKLCQELCWQRDNSTENQTTTDSTRKKYSFTKHQQTATVSTSDRDFFFFVWNKGELCINSTQSTLLLIELMWLNSLKRDSTSLHSRFNFLIFFLQLEKINQ